MGLADNKTLALAHWVRRTKMLGMLVVLAGLFLMYSKYFYSNFIGPVGGAFGVYGAHKAKSEFVFVMIVLLLLEGFKNIALIYFYVEEFTELGTYQYFLLCLLFFEEVILLPYTCYCGYYLYKSLNLG